MTTWLGVLLLFGGLLGVFVLWDLIFCNGARCRELKVRAFELFAGRYRGGPPPR